MNISVCIKQVPDTEAQIKIANNGISIDTSEIKWVINPYDEFAIEEALRIQSKQGGEITAISIGPKRAVESLRTALAMGVDKAILVEEDKSYFIDPLLIAKLLAIVIKPLNSDLILLGQRAVDDDAGLVGPALAELLDLPNLSLATEVKINDNSITITRPIEGQTLILNSSLPAIITTQKGLNEPRYASLPGIMKAKKKPLEIKTLADLGIKLEGKTKIVRLITPPTRTSNKIISGETPQEKAVNLAHYLREEAKII